MALISPGVELSVIDESQYISAPTNSVPFILIATAQNKSVPGSDIVAPGTLAGTSNNVYMMTSQRDLINTFGNPFFYRTTSGTPIHGYELNEYGLLAAYSVLGVSNRAYVVRADIDLAELTARLIRPTGAPADGLYWLDTVESKWGLFEWNKESGVFTAREPIVVDSVDQLDSYGLPAEFIGVPGQFAVNVTNAENPLYYKATTGEWLLVGSAEWAETIPAVVGAEISPVVTNPAIFTINGTTVQVHGDSLFDVVSAINVPGVSGVTAAVVNSKLEIYLNPEIATSLHLANDAESSLLEEIGIVPGEYFAPALQQSPHTVVPRWRINDTVPRPTGSLWVKTTAVNSGVELSIKRYRAIDGRFVQTAVRLFKNDAEANRAFDPSGGGLAIPTNSIYAQYDADENGTATIAIYERVRSGISVVTGLNASPVFAVGDKIEVFSSERGTSTMSGPYEVTINGTNAAAFVSAFNTAGIPNAAADITSTGTIEIKHIAGGSINLRALNADTFGVAGINLQPGLVGVRSGPNNSLIVSNWEALVYTAKSTVPDNRPDANTLWNYSVVNEVDIMINDNGGWKGYRTVESDIRGNDLRLTDAAGPIVAAAPPVVQPTTGTALALGDLWIDTSDLENYPAIYRWTEEFLERKWVRIDNSDQTTQNGIVFADARWSKDGLADPINDPLPSIEGLLLDSRVDPDAPSYTLYPEGTLLFNTRRSGYNVKRYVRDYFISSNFPDVDLSGRPRDAWITAAGNRNDGAPYMGRQATRALVVAAMKAAIDTNENIREEQRAFTLIAAPGYPELIPNMAALNNERRNTAFVIGDTPARLNDSGDSILEWATGGGQDNLTTNDPYSAVFYPSCSTTDLTGNAVVQPPSHMALRTFIRSDAIAYPWMAPAGTRRGLVDNAQALGYINSDTGEFVEVSNRERVRDVLYENRINPLTFIPGAGIVNYGNKTLFSGSVLDRINVARLVAYLRGRLEAIGRQYLFEPNDPLTRNEIKGQVEQLMNEMVATRAIYDYLVVCDESNNTPARIDRNELWLDVAIEPIRSVEFVLIPLRIRNTGEIGA